MNKFASLFILLLVSSLARAEADRSADLRYCLNIKSKYEIAKCAGELTPGRKGQPYSKEEVEKILQKEQATAPVKTNESSSMPATVSDKPVNDLLPGKTENKSN